MKNVKNDIEMKNHIEMKMKITSTAREQTLNNSTLRESLQFERLQMKTTINDEMIDSETTLVVHQADSVSDKRRDRRRNRERNNERESERSSNRERRDQKREREQAAISKKT